MKIGFLGLGKLGLPCALAINSRSFALYGYDINPQINEYLNNKKVPYKEKDMDKLLSNHTIQIAPDIHTVVDQSEIIFLAIQTPHAKEYEGITRIPKDRKDFNYTYLIESIKDVSKALDVIKKKKDIVIISTVLPTTIEKHIKPILSKYANLIYNPYFIAMGTVIPDFFNPEFCLIGSDSSDTKRITRFYQKIHSAPIYYCSIKEAELIKISYNTFIGFKLVMTNMIMEVCDKIGANVDVVMNALRLAKDRLISEKYLDGGMPDSGPCHNRDSIAASFMADNLKLSYNLYEALMEARIKQCEWLANIIATYAVEYRMPVVLMGETYKPNTNLTIGSSATLLKNLLDEENIDTVFYDPYTENNKAPDYAAIYFISTKHNDFIDFKFPDNSIVIDVWRYLDFLKLNKNITYKPIAWRDAKDSGIHHHV